MIDFIKKIWNKIRSLAFNKKEINKPEIRMKIIKPEIIVIHHSLTADSGTVSWNTIRQFHTVDLGWDDIGYNSGCELVNNEFEILIGRMLNEQGAHCRGHNHNSYGHCIVGNYDKDEISPESWMLNLKWIRSLCDVLNLTEDYVLGHRELDSSKSCPGNNFNLDSFRIELKALKITQ